MPSDDDNRRYPRRANWRWLNQIKTKIIGNAIQDGNFSSGLWKVYGAANFLGQGVGFLTEKQITSGNFADCKAMIVANAGYATDLALAGIRDFARRGGMVVLLGAENFKFDQWGRERSECQVDGAKVVTIPLQEEAMDYHRELTRVVESVFTPSGSGFFGDDGRPVWGIETRTVSMGDRTLVYAINVSSEVVAVQLRTNGQTVRWIHGPQFPSLKTQLPPLTPVLVELK